MKIHNSLFSTCLLSLCCSQLAIGQTTEQAAAKEVKAYLAQLDSLSDEELQESAEETCNQILADLEYRPEIEVHKARRRITQQLRVSLAAKMAKHDQSVERLRKSLREQIQTIRDREKNSKLVEYRIRNAIEAHRPSIEKECQYIQVLKTQVAELDRRVQITLTREKLAQDNWTNARNASHLRESIVALPKFDPTPEGSWVKNFLEGSKAKPSVAKKQKSTRSIDNMLAELGINEK